MRHQRANPDVLVARIAARQHGVISVRQLREAGLDKFAVMRRARAGRLHSIHRGIYVVGHPGLSRDGVWMAAALACGDSAVISRRSAASLWGLLPNQAEIPVDVSVPGDGGRRKRAGIRIHRCTSLALESVTRHRRIPTTTPARTVSDLRRVASQSELRRAIRQAEVLGLPLGSEASHDGTRSELEFRFLELCRRCQLPSPDVNVRIGSRIVDFVWRDRRLIVETDGYRYHRGRAAFEDDRARDLELRALGYDVLRLTHRQVADRPAEIAAVLKQALLNRESQEPA